MLSQGLTFAVTTIGLAGAGVVISKFSSKFTHFKQFKFVKDSVIFLLRTLISNKALPYLLGGLTVRCIVRKSMPNVLDKLYTRLPKSIFFHFNPLKFLPYFDDYEAYLFQDGEVPVTPQAPQADDVSVTSQETEVQPIPENPPIPSWLNLANWPEPNVPDSSVESNAQSSSVELNVQSSSVESNVQSSSVELNAQSSSVESNETEAPGQPVREANFADRFDRRATILRHFLGNQWSQD